ncbi:MAG: DUF4974 domain-containing protein [Prevotella sp.]|jgi:ferric-dicitrate binding protein FerR (iron transport regulator)|nr:DUF4974 domain-containing protein [Prevotella sp.]
MESFEQQEQKLDELVSRANIRTNISEMADEAKSGIWENINSRIDRTQKFKTIFRRALIVTTGAAAVFLAGIYLLGGLRIASTEKQMIAYLSATPAPGKIGEISIISDNIKIEVATGEKITHTGDGNILVGGVTKIVADDLKGVYITIVVPKGKQTLVQLSEGTKIWVNSGSKLVYPKKFDGDARNVYLDGEMYIEASRNENAPFCVHTERMDINVLGTKFDVNAYKDEPVNYVVLDEGAVNVESGQKVNMLAQGQGYFVGNDAKQIKAVNVSDYICWKSGRMKLVDEPLDSLAQKLSRYYGVDIIIANTDLSSVRFDGSLSLMDSAEDVLSMLALSHNIKYRKNGGTFEILSKS